METLTTLDVLRRHIAVLACVDETDALFVSCYLNLEQGETGYRKVLEDRISALRSTLEGDARVDFDTAMHQIEAYLAQKLRPGAKGVALFSRQFRGGAFFLPMQFAAPLPDWISVCATPNLFHLMALKDTYHRYVVLVATRARVRILEVNLGAAAVHAWTTQPELRERVGREWTKAHYESHRRERTSRFLKEQIELLDRLMAAGGHTHLILAGDPRLTGEIRRALPKSVASKLVDTIPAAGRDAQEGVVTATLSAFVEWEERDSQAVAARFVQGIRTQGRAVAGATACLDALRERRADTLLLTQNLLPEPGWRCSACCTVGIEHDTPIACPECGKNAVRPIDVAAELVRLAGQQDCPIEVVEHCDPLVALGGVGCLLRY
ncbi:MAG: host attachment protein [Burkholderiales bacterium]|nr:host attachment protein [Burkholderiales bacterium]